MELDEKIFELAYKSLNGKPANTETFRTIARACAGPGIIWLQAVGQLLDMPFAKTRAGMLRRQEKLFKRDFYDVSR